MCHFTSFMVLFLCSAFQFKGIHRCLVQERGAGLSDFTLKSIKQEATKRCDDTSFKVLVSIWNSLFFFFYFSLTLIAFIKHLFSDHSCFLLQVEEGQRGNWLQCRGPLQFNGWQPGHQQPCERAACGELLLLGCQHVRHSPQSRSLRPVWM